MFTMVCACAVVVFPSGFYYEVLYLPLRIETYSSTIIIFDTYISRKGVSEKWIASLMYFYSCINVLEYAQL